MLTFALSAFMTAVSCMGVATAEIPAPPLPEYHLTARPWTPMEIPRDTYLTAVERLCRHVAQHQNDDGAIIDPFLGREHQYSTPYFAFAVGVLIHAEQTTALLANGVAAMEHATRSVEQGNDAIPDQHGEFYLGALAEALAFYEDHVPEETIKRWRTRLEAPLFHIIEGPDVKINNWRAYAMRGEWLRVGAGLADADATRAFIEDGWHNRTQHARIALDRWSLYQDWSSAPQSHAVEAVGRANLLGLVHAGYDGPAADEMRLHVERGSAVSLLLQDPTGQCPPNGRTDNHVFNDVLYQLIFDIMAERKTEAGKLREAGQYRRAAMLAFESIQRWEREDTPFEGTYSITKNHFPIDDRVGYQPASNWTNYTGATMFHLAEAWLSRQTTIAEHPAPTEIGGFALAMDPAFGSAVLNAGGMQVFVNLRGDVIPKYAQFWTPLGIVRFARAGWDSRLGPSDGTYSREARGGVTFGPTWRPGRRWTRVCEHAANFRGTLDVHFVHPLLVKCTLLYHQKTGVSGPVFYQELTITPDGVFSRLRAPGVSDFGLTLPLLKNDGRALEITVAEGIASVQYPQNIGDGDAQHFIALDAEPIIEPGGDAILSTYGHLLPMRQIATGDTVQTFVYPRNGDDPSAEAVRDSFVIREDGFTSALATVDGTLYTGRTAVGGFGDRIDMTGNGEYDIRFSEPCGFIAQHTEGHVTAIEADRDVTVTIDGISHTLQRHTPFHVHQ